MIHTLGNQRSNDHLNFSEMKKAFRFKSICVWVCVTLTGDFLRQRHTRKLKRLQTRSTPTLTVAIVALDNPASYTHTMKGTLAADVSMDGWPGRPRHRTPNPPPAREREEVAPGNRARSGRLCSPMVPMMHVWVPSHSALITVTYCA